jgi:cell division protein FtsB
MTIFLVFVILILVSLLGFRLDVVVHDTERRIEKLEAANAELKQTADRLESHCAYLLDKTSII